MKNCKITLLVLLALTFGSCKKEQEPRTTKVPELDIQAIMADQQGGLIQVLLRLELLNYHGDLLKYGLSDVAAHQERLRYYQLSLKKDLYLLTKTDTIPCLDSHLERINMDAPYRNFILTFLADSQLVEPALLFAENQYTDQIVQLKILENDQH